MNSSLNEEVTKVAYELYEKSGSQEGNDLLNWLAAEKIVNFRKMLYSGISGEAILMLEYKPAHIAESARPSSGKSRSRSRKALIKGYTKEIGVGL
jgi:hypothetical protein